MIRARWDRHVWDKRVKKTGSLIVVHCARDEPVKHVEGYLWLVTRSHVTGIPDKQVPQVLNWFHFACKLPVAHEGLECNAWNRNTKWPHIIFMLTSVLALLYKSLPSHVFMFSKRDTCEGWLVIMSMVPSYISTCQMGILLYGKRSCLSFMGMLWPHTCSPCSGPTTTPDQICCFSWCHPSSCCRHWSSVGWNPYEWIGIGEWLAWHFLWVAGSKCSWATSLKLHVPISFLTCFQHELQLLSSHMWRTSRSCPPPGRSGIILHHKRSHSQSHSLLLAEVS